MGHDGPQGSQPSPECVQGPRSRGRCWLHPWGRMGSTSLGSCRKGHRLQKEDKGSGPEGLRGRASAEVQMLPQHRGSEGETGGQRLTRAGPPRKPRRPWCRGHRERAGGQAGHVWSTYLAGRSLQSWAHPAARGRAGRGGQGKHALIYNHTNKQRPAPVASAANEREGGLRARVAEGRWHRKNGSERSLVLHNPGTCGKPVLAGPALPGPPSPKGGLWGTNDDT